MAVFAVRREGRCEECVFASGGRSKRVRTHAGGAKALEVGMVKMEFLGLDDDIVSGD